MYKASATVYSDIRLRLVPRLGLSGFIPPFPHVPSRYAQTELCCTIHLLPFTFSRNSTPKWNHFARTCIPGHTALRLPPYVLYNMLFGRLGQMLRSNLLAPSSG
jgi:hypothetical protein